MAEYEVSSLGVARSVYDPRVCRLSRTLQPSRLPGAVHPGKHLGRSGEQPWASEALEEVFRGANFSPRERRSRLDQRRGGQVLHPLRQVPCDLQEYSPAD